MKQSVASQKKKKEKEKGRLGRGGKLNLEEVFSPELSRNEDP